MKLMLICILVLRASTAFSSKAESMQSFAESLFELHRHISSQNKDAILSALSELEKSNHSLEDYSGLLSVSESYYQYEQQITTYIPLLRRAVENSNFSQARMLTHQLSELCAACHASSKIKDSKNFANQTLPEDMSLVQRASFLAATRQHEKALLEYERALDNLDANQPEWEHALFESLNIIVRIKNSASLALELISKLIETKSDLSQQQKSMLLSWRSDIKKQINNDSTSSSERKVSKENLITVLFALSRLEIKDLEKQEYLLDLAELHIKLANFFPWARPHYFYQICIEKNPHTQLSQACWENLKTHLGLSSELIAKYEFLTRLSRQAQIKKAKH